MYVSYNWDPEICPLYRGVRYRGVSIKWGFTVTVILCVCVINHAGCNEGYFWCVVSSSHCPTWSRRQLHPRTASPEQEKLNVINYSRPFFTTLIKNVNNVYFFSHTYMYTPNTRYICSIFWYSLFFSKKYFVQIRTTFILCVCVYVCVCNV